MASYWLSESFRHTCPCFDHIITLYTPDLQDILLLHDMAFEVKLSLHLDHITRQLQDHLVRLQREDVGAPVHSKLGRWL